jgi:hypothetical protein
MENNFKKGQTVRIIGDNFTTDQHGFENGTLGIIEEFVPFTPFEELPPFVQLIYALGGDEGVDLPARIHLHILDEDGDIIDEMDGGFANVLPEDIEPIAQGGQQIVLLEDDIAEGFDKGDVFETHVFDGEVVFTDKDGDYRRVENFEHKVIG